MFNIITEDLGQVPVCIANANNVEDVIAALESWVVDGVLSARQKFDIVEEMYRATAPGDGIDLLTTDRIELPNQGLEVNICFDDNLWLVAPNCGWSDKFFDDLLTAATDDMQRHPEVSQKAWAEYDEVARIMSDIRSGKRILIPRRILLHAHLLICEDTDAFYERVRGFTYAWAMQRIEDERKNRFAPCEDTTTIEIVEPTEEERKQGYF